jgi:hypothetical protein
MFNMMIAILTALGLVSAKVFIEGPDDLRDSIMQNNPGFGEIPSSLANFGNPPYGTAINGQLYLTSIKNDTLACSDLQPIEFNPEDISSPIVLVERGECPFVMKVRHAQDIGAKGVIVVDNKDGEDVERIIMADNGTGGNISIPSFMISKSDGDILREYLTSGANKNHV